MQQIIWNIGLLNIHSRKFFPRYAVILSNFERKQFYLYIQETAYYLFCNLYVTLY